MNNENPQDLKTNKQTVKPSMRNYAMDAQNKMLLKRLYFDI